MGQGLIYPRKGTKMFEVYSKSVKRFKDHHYLINPLNEVAHANICSIDFKPPYQCLDKFSMFLCQSHFLEDVGSYVDKLDELS